jgi:hypothetical protein
VNCALNAVSALAASGVIIWDNAERPEYASGIAGLEQQQFRRLDFDGLGPVNSYGWRTSIFYRDGNCLGV